MREYLSSLIFWIRPAIFPLFPDTISAFVARVFGIASNVNAVIFLGMRIMIYLIFMLYGEVRKNRRQVTKLARQVALRDAERKTVE
ncbi:MAG: hypothetical protein ACI94D_000145 [Neolewinella sp.]